MFEMFQLPFMVQAFLPRLSRELFYLIWEFML